MIINETGKGVNASRLFVYLAFLVLAVFAVLGAFAYHEFRQTQKMLDQVMSTVGNPRTTAQTAISSRTTDQEDTQMPQNQKEMSQYIKEEINAKNDTLYGEVTQIATVPNEGMYYITIRTGVVDTDKLNSAKIGEPLPKKDIEYTAIFKSDTLVKDATVQDIRLGDFLAVSTGGKTIDSVSFEAASAEILKESTLHGQR